MSKVKASLKLIQSNQSNAVLYNEILYLSSLKGLNPFTLRSKFVLPEKINGDQLCKIIIGLNRLLLNRESGMFIPPPFKQFHKTAFPVMLKNPHYYEQALAARALLCNPPEAFIVHGDLDLSDITINALPEALTVKGSLDLRGTRLRLLPESLVVGKDLYLDGQVVLSLGAEPLNIGGRLNLCGQFFDKKIIGGNLK